MASVAGPTRSPSVRDRQGAPKERGGRSSGLEHWSAGVPKSGVLRPWARAGSHRFPGDPSHAFALLQDPGRADRISPLAILSMLPPGHPSRRPQRVHNLEADTGLRHPLSTLHERRRRRPCKTRFRLAGCASTERGVEPSGSLRKVSGYISVLLSRTSPVASRVDGDVAAPIPHRPGRADFPHPVLHERDSLAAA
jgi:hypothetical protein